MTAHEESLPIIVGVDGSPASVEALAFAARLALAFDTALTAVTTWTYPVMAVPFDPGTEWSPQQEAQRCLDDAVLEAFQGSPPVRFTSATMPGRAAEVLIERSAHASTLVVGSRGHGGFAGLLLGSVSAACAAHAHCPVLVVHSPTPPVPATGPSRGSAVGVNPTS
ncbi:universal stress protein [Microbacterium sp. SSW1-49]|uniref:Universal stress protein n=1 Tax=Microbacterium croceum TaxID=2851645 RepID=A0ABT0FGE9_9MICO|nr:universal stress protein [Microbacterium croceum]MCK2036782.1 universal stress protein [Microbacterium croceum]